MQQGVHLVGGDTLDGLFFVDQAFVGHIHGDLDLGFGGALAVAGLQHPQLAALDGELHVLHVFVMLFEAGGDLHELIVGFGQLVSQVLDFSRVADAGHHVFALGVEQVVAVHFLLAGGRVTGEGHAGAGVPAHVAKDHGDDVDGGAQVVRDAGGIAVINGALAVPGFEDGFGGQAQLLVGVLGEVEAFVLA